jgi:uncharacterized membrane protein YphA (DoxX/SURF4 family)
MNPKVSMNRKLQSFALTGLRLALATAFLSAVAGRLGLWGKYGSGWAKFVAYTGSLNWYLPARIVLPVAITSTILETAFGLALLAGFQIRNAALGSAGLLMLFALAMFTGDPKSPFDYSVFTAAFGAFALAAFTGHNATDVDKIKLPPVTGMR